ncbi:MAG: peptidyl-prolyl cis-trans isomerase [Candidatus Eisenbacteria bacterium]|nr:peptidyl-prolyl cis-trans isomerase [Candidatus Eisenbacteria bacterium]
MMETRRLVPNSPALPAVIFLGLLFVLVQVVFPLARGPETVATVDGLKVTRNELNQAADPLLASVAEQVGGDVSEETRTDVMKAVLNDLIAARLVLNEATKLKLTVSESDIDYFLKNTSQFITQGLSDSVVFKKFKTTKGSGYKEATEIVRNYLLTAKMYDSMKEKLTPTEEEILREFGRKNQRVILSYIVLPAEGIFKFAHATSAEALEYYKRHPEEFTSGDLMRVEMILVKVPGKVLAGGTAVLDEKATLREAGNLLSALKSGRSFRALGEKWGGAKVSALFSLSDPVPFAGKIPGLGDKLSSLRAGEVLYEPIRVENGLGIFRMAEKVPSYVKSFEDVTVQAAAASDRERRFLQSRDELVKLYDRKKEEYRTTLLTVDTLTISLGEIGNPSMSGKELKEYYEKHRTEFLKYDSESGTAEYLTFKDVKDEIAAKLVGDKIDTLARQKALSLRNDLAAGKMKRLASSGHQLGKAGPFYLGLIGSMKGAPKDILEQARTVNEGDWGQVIRTPGGYSIFRVNERKDDVVPPFDILKDELLYELQQEEARKEAEETYQFFLKNQSNYLTGEKYKLSYAFFPILSPDSVKVSEKEISEYYRENAGEFVTPEAVRVREIFFPSYLAGVNKDEARAKAEAVAKRCSSGRDFASLASEFSADEEGKRKGGDLGFVERRMLPAALEDVVFSMKTGEIRGPLESEVGYHIFKMEAKRPAGKRSLDEVRPFIVARLKDVRRESIPAGEAEKLVREPRSVAEFEQSMKGKWNLNESAFFVKGDDIVGPGSGAILAQVISNAQKGKIFPGIIRLQSGFLVFGLKDKLEGKPIPFEQAKNRVQQDYQREKDSLAVQQMFEELQARVAEGESFNEMGAILGGVKETIPFVPFASEAQGKCSGLDAFPGLIDSARETEIRGTGGPFVSPAGIALFRVKEKLPPDKDFLAERDKIERDMLSQRVEDWTEGLREKAKIEILDQRLR